jgi:acrylyl-CoA reductase (NADPH)
MSENTQDHFPAICLTKQNDTTHAELRTLTRADLPPGDVTVQVSWSGINYKDALAVTGRGAVVRQFPMVPGIDLAGTVEHSNDPAWTPGQPVVVTGWGIGEGHWGGLAGLARVQSGWLLPLPEGMSARDAMILGTAGVTAGLCVDALLRHGLGPDDGEILVTGAAGGVGSVAVILLAALGFDVVASTGRLAEADYLKSLGARHVADRADLSQPGRPLQKERWAGVVDSVGSHTLANACAATRSFGAVAACGLAQGADFPATVMPFILRGVSLYGINSVLVPNTRRKAVWELLRQHVGRAHLDAMAVEVSLDQVIQHAPKVLAGQVRGHTVVRVA